MQGLLGLGNYATHKLDQANKSTSNDAEPASSLKTSFLETTSQ